MNAPIAWIGRIALVALAVAVVAAAGYPLGRDGFNQLLAEHPVLTIAGLGVLFGIGLMLRPSRK